MFFPTPFCFIPLQSGKEGLDSMLKIGTVFKGEQSTQVWQAPPDNLAVSGSKTCPSSWLLQLGSFTFWLPMKHARLIQRRSETIRGHEDGEDRTEPVWCLSWRWYLIPRPMTGQGGWGCWQWFYNDVVDDDSDEEHKNTDSQASVMFEVGLDETVPISTCPGTLTRIVLVLEADTLEKDMNFWQRQYSPR